MPTRLPRWAFTVLAVLTTGGLAWLLEPWAGPASTYVLFTAGAFVSARYGGIGSGLAATAAGGAFALRFAAAPASAADWPLLAVFVAMGALVSYLAGVSATGAATARHPQLEAELAEARRAADEQRKEADRLREVASVKDAFLATVAHELRTPLSAMLGWAHVLREEKVDEATSARALDAILRNARQQTRLISDLMDISRIVAGTMRLDMQTVKPVSVIRAALETVRPAADAKRITLTSNVDAEAGPLTGDPSRLQQVLWNLLANSIKFTPAGGTVGLAVRAVDGQVEVKVEDTGPGIPPAFLPHVFEQFRQAGGAATPSKGGLGLGLAIARSVVELHQGKIVAANREPGPGAVFTLRLPVKMLRPGEARPTPAPAVAHELELEGRLPSLDGLYVGVMDADEGREMVATILQKRGARVVPLSSPEEALAILGDQPPDVLLLDLDLADAGEDSLIQKIRALPAGAGGDVPAAALAAFGASDRTRALLSGFQLQLMKPVRPAELVAAVASLSGRTRPKVEAEQAPA